MRIVAKNNIGDPYLEIGRLTPEQWTLLKAWRAGGNLNADSLRRQAAILASVADKKAWIVCDCLDNLGVASPQPPVMFPRQRNGTYSLQGRTCEGRSPHAVGCPFHWEEGEFENTRRRQSPHPGRPASDAPPDFVLYKHMEAFAADPDAPAISTRTSGAAKSDALQRRMFYLMQQAGINRFVPGTPPVRDKDRIRQVCQAIRLFEKIHLEDVAWVSTHWLTEGWAKNRLRTLRLTGRWPDDIPVQGLCMFSATAIDGSQITCGGKGPVLEIERPVNVFAGATPARAPYVALVSVRLDEKKDKLRLLRAYAHPRYVGEKDQAFSWCPVDSDYERSALGAILYVAREMRGKGLEIIVEKPLADIYPDGSDIGCRPDFLIRAGGKSICVETMGSADQEYRTRKAGMHQLMRKIGPVIEDERVGVDPEKASRLLKEKLFYEMPA